MNKLMLRNNKSRLSTSKSETYILYIINNFVLTTVLQLTELLLVLRGIFISYN